MEPRYKSNRAKGSFSVDDFLHRLGDRNKACKCARQCFKSISRQNLEKHAKAVDLHRNLALAPDEANRVFWSWIMSMYLLCLNEKNNVTSLRLPAFKKHRFCLHAWLELCDIKESTFHMVKKSFVSTRDVVRETHGNVGEQRAIRLEARANARKFIMEQATRHAHPLPLYLSTAHGGDLAPEESMLIFPPSFSVRGLSTMYDTECTEESQKVSRTQFRRILTEDFPFVRISRTERGICDICMCFRHKLRMVDDEKVSEVAEIWGTHLAYAVNSRDEHNACRNEARKLWSMNLSTRLERADISCDYAKQAGIPVVAAGTTADFFVQKQGLDVNMFGVLNEGTGKQVTFLTSEGAKHDSNSVTSQLHYYLNIVEPRLSNVRTLYVHMDSCSGQNKNNIMLGYMMLRVLHGYHDLVVLKYMTVGHTKFGPDRVFGHIRQRMAERDALCLPEFKTNIVDVASLNSEGFVFDHYEHVRDYKKGSSMLFTKLPGFRAQFYYTIKIEKCATGRACVSTGTKPGDFTDVHYCLQTNITSFPSLTDDAFFPKVKGKVISAARRSALRNSIWKHIQERFPEREPHVDEWWSRFLRFLDNYAASSSSIGASVQQPGTHSGQNQTHESSMRNASQRSGAVIMQSVSSPIVKRRKTS